MSKHTREGLHKALMASFVAAALAAGGCSAMLDTDKLQNGEDDAGPYDVSASYKGMTAMPHRTLAMATEADFFFRWRQLPGQPNGYDLALQVGKDAAFQVFAREGRPFARLGLSVVPLAPNDTYHFSSRREGGTLRLSLFAGERLLAQDTRAAGRLGLLIAPAPVGGSRVHVVLAPQPLRERQVAVLLR